MYVQVIHIRAHFDKIKSFRYRSKMSYRRNACSLYYVKTRVDLNFQKNLVAAFAKLRKVTISFVMSISLSVRVTQLCSH